MTPKEILVKARDILSDPNRWQKEEYGYDLVPDGTPVGSRRERDEGMYCAVGAIAKAARVPVYLAEIGPVYDILVSCIPGREEHPEPETVTVADYNDAGGTTHQDILALFDCAISKAKE